MKKSHMLFVAIVLSVLSASIMGCSSGSAENNYTREMIGETCETDNFNERSFKFGKIECTNLHPSDLENENYKYDFYLFEKEKDAKSALKYIKKEWIQDAPKVETDNSVNGLEAGVMDASCILYAYQTKNLIVTMHDDAVGCDPEFADASQDFHDRLYNDTENFYGDFREAHEEIAKKWP